MANEEFPDEFRVETYAEELNGYSLATDPVFQVVTRSRTSPSTEDDTETSVDILWESSEELVVSLSVGNAQELAALLLTALKDFDADEFTVGLVSEEDEDEDENEDDVVNSGRFD